MKELYVISVCFDYWNTSSVKTIFATEDENYAKQYCTKANNLMDRYEPYYEQLHEQLYEELMNDFDEKHLNKSYYRLIGERLYFVSGVFGYKKLELRK